MGVSIPKEHVHSIFQFRAEPKLFRESGQMVEVLKDRFSKESSQSVKGKFIELWAVT